MVMSVASWAVSIISRMAIPVPDVRWFTGPSSSRCLMSEQPTRTGQRKCDCSHLGHVGITCCMRDGIVMAISEEQRLRSKAARPETVEGGGSERKSN